MLAQNAIRQSSLEIKNKEPISAIGFDKYILRIQLSTIELCKNLFKN